MIPSPARNQDAERVRSGGLTSTSLLSMNQPKVQVTSRPDSSVRSTSNEPGIRTSRVRNLDSGRRASHIHRTPLPPLDEERITPVPKAEEPEPLSTCTNCSRRELCNDDSREVGSVKKKRSGKSRSRGSKEESTEGKKQRRVERKGRRKREAKCDCHKRQHNILFSIDNPEVRASTPASRNDPSLDVGYGVCLPPMGYISIY